MFNVCCCFVVIVVWHVLLMSLWFVVVVLFVVDIWCSSVLYVFVHCLLVVGC